MGIRNRNYWYFDLGIIDLGDINQLPSSGGGLTIRAAFFHELYEQWLKSGGRTYQESHKEAVNSEVLVSGNRRVGERSHLHLGWNPFNQSLSGKITFRYRRVLKTDKDGKEELDSKTAIQTIDINNSRVSGVRIE